MPRKQKAKEKPKRPGNVSYRLLVKNELDKLLGQYEKRQLGEEEAKARLDELLDQYPEDVEADVFSRLDKWSPDYEGAMLWALSTIADEDSKARLWAVVHSPERDLGAKMAALTVLKKLGEEIDMQHPPIVPGPDDLEAARGAMERMLDKIIEDVEGASGSDELQEIMVIVDQIREQAPDGDNVLLYVIQSIAQRGTSSAADFLLALSDMASSKNVRKEAKRALYKLRLKGIEPKSRSAKAIHKDVFHKAYASDLNTIGEQQQLFMAWELEGGKVQALSFLIDLYEMNGAIKDFFVSHGMTKRELTNIVKQSEKMAIPMEEVAFVEARAIVEDAMEMNQQEGVAFPKDFQRYRRLVEKRILDVEVDPKALQAAKEKRTALKAQVPEGLPAFLFGPDADEEDDFNLFDEEEFLFGSIAPLTPEQERRLMKRYPDGEFADEGLYLDDVDMTEADKLLGKFFDLYITDEAENYYCRMYFDYDSALFKRLSAYELENEGGEVAIDVERKGKRGIIVWFCFYLKEETEEEYEDDPYPALKDLFLQVKQDILEGYDDVFQILHNVYEEGRYKGFKSRAGKTLRRILDNPF